MAVLIGNASLSENGTVRGKAGDQTGKEVTTRKWYRHSKGWYALECLVPGMEEYIAEAMEKACANPDIGYNQYENNTLWENVKPFGYDPSRTTKKVNTDCARLVRVCVQYACVKMGLDIIIPDFYTATMANVLVRTGLFRKLSDPKYTAQDLYLRRGWPMVTRTKGHAIVVLENGSKAGATTVPGSVFELGNRMLRNGDEGADVKELQSMLIQKGYDLGRWGADGDFGDATEMAVRAFQEAAGIEIDGVVGEDTYAALTKAGSEDVPTDAKFVKIEGGDCYARAEPNTSGTIIGTARRGEKFAYLGETSESGWLRIQFGMKEAWVSGKYGRLE